MAWDWSTPMNDVPTHKPGPRNTLDRSPEAFNRSRFYRSKEWRKVRLIHLSRHPLCIACLDAGRLAAGSTVHHVITTEARPDLALSLDNLKTLCASCHSALHAKKGPTS